MPNKDGLTLQGLIKELKITMTASPADSNPNMPDRGEKCDNWLCVLRRPKSRMTVPFSMGLGHEGKQPNLEDVLDCLASDAVGVVDAPGFSEWCKEFGYSDDSRAAERTYNAVRRQSARLRAFLGDNGYDDLLWNVERQ